LLLLPLTPKLRLGSVVEGPAAPGLAADFVFVEKNPCRPVDAGSENDVGADDAQRAVPALLAAAAAVVRVVRHISRVAYIDISPPFAHQIWLRLKI
jgi:hypothetical protein